MANTTKTINAWEWDVRVRERNLRKGILDDEDVEKHLSPLPDMADQAENIGLAQPALGGREELDRRRRPCRTRACPSRLRDIHPVAQPLGARAHG